MKLLFVLPAYEPAWALGGVVRSMSNLCRGLAALGHDITVYTINTDGCGKTLNMPENKPINHGGVITYYFQSTFGPKSLFDSRALIRNLRNNLKCFDLVYVSAIWQWLGLSVSDICSRQQAPLIIGTHGSFNKTHFQVKRMRKYLFWYLFLEKAMSKANAVHFTTEYERREKINLLKKLDSFIVPNGIDCEVFRPISSRLEFRRLYGIPDNAPVIVTVVRADPAKRVDLLIQALASIPEYYLVIVGPESGNLTSTWKNLAKDLNLTKYIIWPGYLKDEDVIRAYSAADIFSLISRNENFGMVVIEAMACGLPVVINSEVGVWEAIHRNSVVFTVEQNSKSIANALKDFLDNRSKWSLWKDQNIQAVKQSFSTEKIAGLMTRACLDILNNTRSLECHWQIL